MIVHNNILIVVFAITSLVSCSSNQFDRYEHFPKNDYLIAEKLYLDTALLRYPFRIQIKDSIAIVMDLHPKEYYFHVYSYPKFCYILSFGRLGDAPNELLSADNFNYINNDSIWVLDANKMQMSRWGISNNNKYFEQKEALKLNRDLIRTLDFELYTDSLFIVPSYTGKYRYATIQNDGQIINTMSTFPTEQNSITEDNLALAQAWRSFIDFNSKKGILALVTQLGEVIEIYNLQNNTHKVLYGPNGEPNFEISNGYGIPTGIMGFSDVQVTDKYIYAVFHGHSFKEIANRIKKGAPSIDGGKYIYVFSLTGEPVCSYTLDRYIYGIDVNEEKGIITAVDVNSDEPIVQFKI